MVIRTIANEIPDFAKLGLPDTLKEIIMTKRGLVLVVGATGSGKSTSLAAMIDHRNKNSAGHIVTVEDPVEFVHTSQQSLITHREVGIDTHSWHNALKNTLRQAPDVILIGEIRDTETMEHAIAFAETGHLCLGTLHSNSANQTIDRIINFFSEERRKQLLMDLSSNLRAIISQRLVKTADGKGRRAAIEILINTPIMADKLLKGEFHEIKAIMGKSRELGMKTFDYSLFELYNEGAISYDEAIRNADSANELRLNIKLSGTRQPGSGELSTEPSLQARRLAATTLRFPRWCDSITPSKSSSSLAGGVHTGSAPLCESARAVNNVFSSWRLARPVQANCAPASSKRSSAIAMAPIAITIVAAIHRIVLSIISPSPLLINVMGGGSRTSVAAATEQDVGEDAGEAGE